MNFIDHLGNREALGREFREVMNKISYQCLHNSPTCHKMGGDELCPFITKDGKRLCDVFTGIPGNAWISDIEEVCERIKVT